MVQLVFLAAPGQNAAEWNFGQTDSEMQLYVRCVMLCLDAKLCRLLGHKKHSPALLQACFISQPLISARRTALNQRDHKLCLKRQSITESDIFS